MSTLNPFNRRRFLAAGGAVGAAGLIAGNGSAEIKPRFNTRIDGPSRKGGIIGGSENVELPPFAVRVLNKMGFGPARRELGTVTTNPDVILATGFETLTSNFATQDDVAHFLALGPARPR